MVVTTAEAVVVGIVCILAAGFFLFIAYDQRTSWLPSRAKSEELKKERMGKAL